MNKTASRPLPNLHTGKFVSEFTIRLTQEQHGLVARFAVQSGIMMDEAVGLLFDASVYMVECEESRGVVS